MTAIRSTPLPVRRVSVTTANQPYGALSIDGVVYTYAERTQLRWSHADAANIAASISVDRGRSIPQGILTTSYSKKIDLTTVELNRTVQEMLHSGW